MQITGVALSCRLGSQADFVLGPGESKSNKTLYNRTFLGSLMNTCQMDKFINVSLFYVLSKPRCVERSFPLNAFL